MSGCGRGTVPLGEVAESSAMRDCCRPVPNAEETDETARACVSNALGSGMVVRGGDSVSKEGGLGSSDR